MTPASSFKAWTALLEFARSFQGVHSGFSLCHHINSFSFQCLGGHRLESYRCWEHQSKKESGNSISPVCISIAGEVRTLVHVPSTWSSPTIAGLVSGFQLRIEKEINENVTLRSRGCSVLLSVTVRLGTQVYFESKRGLLWLDSACAAICGRRLYTGHCTWWWESGCVATSFSAVSYLVFLKDGFFLSSFTAGRCSSHLLSGQFSSILLSLFSPSVSALPLPWPSLPILQHAWFHVWLILQRNKPSCVLRSPVSTSSCSFFKTRLPKWVLCPYHLPLPSQVSVILPFPIS